MALTSGVPPVIINNYEYEINLLSVRIAILVTFMIWGLFLVVKLHYGTDNINKLTFKPLKWAFIFFFAQLIYLIAKYIKIQYMPPDFTEY